MAKENSAKSAATKSVVDETSATKGETRPAIKSVSGVKTSAAAFFRRSPENDAGQGPVRIVDGHRSRDAGRGDIGSAHGAGAPASLAKLPESGTTDGTKSSEPRDGAAEGDWRDFARGGRREGPPQGANAEGTGLQDARIYRLSAHGVGQITAIEEQEVAGYKLELFVISFVKDKMILKVPLPKIASVGMRKLAEAPVVKRALDTLTGRARIKRTMWSRRAQEYEAKINSGDLVAIAEVVRDL